MLLLNTSSPCLQGRAHTPIPPGTARLLGRKHVCPCDSFTVGDEGTEYEAFKDPRGSCGHSLKIKQNVAKWVHQL